MTTDLSGVSRQVLPLLADTWPAPTTAASASPAVLQPPSREGVEVAGFFDGLIEGTQSNLRKVDNLFKGNGFVDPQQQQEQLRQTVPPPSWTGGGAPPRQPLGPPAPVKTQTTIPLAPGQTIPSITPGGRLQQVGVSPVTRQLEPVDVVQQKLDAGLYRELTIGGRKMQVVEGAGERVVVDPASGLRRPFAAGTTNEQLQKSTLLGAKPAQLDFARGANLTVESLAGTQTYSVWKDPKGPGYVAMDQGGMKIPVDVGKLSDVYGALQRRSGGAPYDKLPTAELERRATQAVLKPAVPPGAPTGGVPQAGRRDANLASGVGAFFNGLLVQGPQDAWRDTITSLGRVGDQFNLAASTYGGYAQALLGNQSWDAARRNAAIGTLTLTDRHQAQDRQTGQQRLAERTPAQQFGAQLFPQLASEVATTFIGARAGGGKRPGAGTSTATPTRPAGTTAQVDALADTVARFKQGGATSAELTRALSQATDAYKLQKQPGQSAWPVDVRQRFALQGGAAHQALANAPGAAGTLPARSTTEHAGGLAQADAQAGLPAMSSLFVPGDSMPAGAADDAPMVMPKFTLDPTRPDPDTKRLPLFRVSGSDGEPRLLDGVEFKAFSMQRDAVKVNPLGEARNVYLAERTRSGRLSLEPVRVESSGLSLTGNPNFDVNVKFQIDPQSPVRFHVDGRWQATPSLDEAHDWMAANAEGYPRQVPTPGGGSRRHDGPAVQIDQPHGTPDEARLAWADQFARYALATTHPASHPARLELGALMVETRRPDGGPPDYSWTIPVGERHARGTITEESLQPETARVEANPLQRIVESIHTHPQAPRTGDALDFYQDAFSFGDVAFAHAQGWAKVPDWRLDVVTPHVGDVLSIGLSPQGQAAQASGQMGGARIAELLRDRPEWFDYTSTSRGPDGQAVTRPRLDALAQTAPALAQYLGSRTEPGGLLNITGEGWVNHLHGYVGSAAPPAPPQADGPSTLSLWMPPHEPSAFIRVGRQAKVTTGDRVPGHPAATAGEPQALYIETSAIKPGDLAVRVAPSRQFIQRPVLPERLDDVPRVDHLRLTKSHLVSGVHSGSNGSVVLGNLGGQPVAVKQHLPVPGQRPRQARDEFLVEVRSAKLLSDLGVGPRFHGIAAGKDGTPLIVTDLVPGDFPAAYRGRADNPIGAVTFRDLDTALERFETAGITSGLRGLDFQYYVTPEGRLMVIDPGDLSTGIGTARNHQPDAAGGSNTHERARLLGNAPTEVGIAYLAELKRLQPAAFQGLRIKVESILRPGSMPNFAGMNANLRPEDFVRYRRQLADPAR